MSETRMSSREANQDFSRAKRAVKDGPVIITERGRPSQVLISYEHYRRLTGAEPNILELLAATDAADIDLPLPERRIEPTLEIETD